MTNTFREEIDTTVEHQYDVLTFEWFRIQNLNNIRAIIRKECYSEQDKRIYLFGRHDDCFQKGAQIFIHLYNFPTDNSEYEEKLSNYEEQRKSFPLNNKQKFNDTILSLPLLSKEFHEHLTFQTKDGSTRRRIVHSYRNKDKGIIIIYSLDANDFIENSFFNEVAKNCTIE